METPGPTPPMRRPGRTQAQIIALSYELASAGLGPDDLDLLVASSELPVSKAPELSIEFVELSAEKEPTWFPDSTTSPEDARRWLDENHDWVFADEPSTSDKDDEDYC